MLMILITHHEHHQHEETHATLELVDDGSVSAFSIKYVVEQVRSWGGSMGYINVAPSRAYYNMSRATAVGFNYRVITPTDQPGRTILNFNLLDVSNCVDGCGAFDMENHISYNHFLGSEPLSEATKVVLGTDAFSLPGGAGILGNQKLDRDLIKGFNIIFFINFDGEIGDVARGEVELSNFTAVGEWTEKTFPTCAVEPGFSILVWDDFENEYSQRLRFRSPEECCELCHQDPDCLFGMTTAWRTCFLFNEIRPGQVHLRNDEMYHPFPVFYKDTARGTFCEKCDCDAETRSIDCRGKNLKIAPRLSFSDEEDSARNLLGWEPRSVDLSDNPRLIVLLSDTFLGMESLEELKLPKNLAYLPKESVENLTLLAIIEVEEAMETTELSSGTQLINAITDSRQKFSHMCCGQGPTIGTPSNNQWMLCDMVQDALGIDSIFEPFIEYTRPRYPIREIYERSIYMSEATESVEKCAEFCHVQKDCRYFVHDMRSAGSEKRCLHFVDQGTREERCCGKDQYADRNQTIPGMTSGWVPATRHELHNARVIVEASVESEDMLKAGPENNFTVQYQVSLGAKPIRGAVWVTPTIASSFVSGIEVRFSPPWVVLYDDKTIVPVEVSVTNPTQLQEGGSFVVGNSIESCDAAFQATPSCSDGNETVVHINFSLNSPSVDKNQLDRFRPAGMVIFSLLFLVSCVFVVWVVRNHNRRIVKSSQPVFLIFLCTGSIILASTIIPLSLDDSILHSDGGCVGCECSKCDMACMAAPWLFFTGFTLIFASLFSKIWRLNQLINNAKRFRRVTITWKDVLIPLVVLLGLNLVILSLWTGLDGMFYQRSKRCGADEFTSYGSCQLGHHGVSVSMACALAFINLAALILANVQAYKAWKVATEFNEAKWIGIAMICIFQIFMIGLPLMFLVQDTPAALYFVQLGIISVIHLAVLLLIFVPKILLLRQSLRETNGLSDNNAGHLLSFHNPGGGSSQFLTGSTQFGGGSNQFGGGSMHFASSAKSKDVSRTGHTFNDGSSSSSSFPNSFTAGSKTFSPQAGAAEGSSNSFAQSFTLPTKIEEEGPERIGEEGPMDEDDDMSNIVEDAARIDEDYSTTMNEEYSMTINEDQSATIHEEYPTTSSDGGDTTSRIEAEDSVTKADDEDSTKIDKDSAAAIEEDSA